MCSSTTAERQSLASRDRTCCLRRCLPARPLRYYGFRGSIAHPTQSLCTLRTRRRRRPRNTRYRAPATAYPDRSLTGRTTPAYLAHKQSMRRQRKRGLLRRFAPRNAAILRAQHRAADQPALLQIDQRLVGLGQRHRRHRNWSNLFAAHEIEQLLGLSEVADIAALDRDRLDRDQRQCPRRAATEKADDHELAALAEAVEPELGGGGVTDQIDHRPDRATGLLGELLQRVGRFAIDG